MVVNTTVDENKNQKKDPIQIMSELSFILCGLKQSDSFEILANSNDYTDRKAVKVFYIVWLDGYKRIEVFKTMRHYFIDNNIDCRLRPNGSNSKESINGFTKFITVTFNY